MAMGILVIVKVQVDWSKEMERFLILDSMLVTMLVTLMALVICVVSWPPVMDPEPRLEPR